MGIKIAGDIIAGIRLNNVAERSSKAAAKALEKGAKDLARLAARMTPFDLGALESSIDVRKISRGGLNRRNAWEIFVRDVPSGRGTETTQEYALMVHEGLHLRGGSIGGPGTIAKQKANPDVEVGPFFMDRAVEELEPEISNNINIAVQNAIKQALR